MKKLIGLIIVCILTLNAIAQDNESMKMQKPQETSAKYCAMLKDGKIKMMQDTRDLVADVTLSNGVKIKTDGTVIKSDGTQITLKNGECVDNNGTVMNPKSEDKMKKEESQIPPK
jgi:hypothetical protein